MEVRENERIDRYRELLEVVRAQKNSLKDSNFKGLEELTEKKGRLLKQIDELERLLGPKAKNEDSNLDSLKNLIVEEDRSLNTLLKDKEKSILEQIENVKRARKNITKVSSVYGKKFSLPSSRLNKEC